MPTVLRVGPYRFYFYSHEPNEPPHVHIDRDRSTAKFWLEAVSLASSIGFSAKELRNVQTLGRVINSAPKPCGISITAPVLTHDARGWNPGCNKRVVVTDDSP